MKFCVFIIIVVLASVSRARRQPGKFELESVSEYEPTQVRREKRTLTTICVEIKPTSPYEEPYFMCKGTDMPQFSKGASGSQSYPSKQSYKPKPSVSYEESDSYQPGVKIDYNIPIKTDYHSEQSKYGKPIAYDSKSDYSASSKPMYDKKPSYSDHGTYSAYSSYEPPKSSHGAKPYVVNDGHEEYSKPIAHKPTYSSIYEKPSSHYAVHDSHDEYSKPIAHKPTYSATYEKPSSHYEPTYSTKLKPYSHDSHSYGHNESPEYSKPSLNEHSSSYDSKHSYNEGSHPKPSYGHSSYSAESKSGYSKPSSYTSKPTYEHSDQSSYGESKQSYNDQSSAKQYPASYSKPAYSTNEYTIPLKQYAEKGYNPSSTKASTYSHTQHDRSMTEDMMQPMFDVHSQDIQTEGFGYRSMDIPMAYYNFEIPRMVEQDPQQQHYNTLNEPMRIDISAKERDAPTLQSPYAFSPYTQPALYGQDVSSTPYGPAIPSYTPATPSYSAAAPTYGPISLPYAPVSPSYASSAPSYALPYMPVTPTYTPATSSYPQATPAYGHGKAIQSHVHPVQVYKPTCQQSYLYSLQPTIISLPCFSSQPNYGQYAYTQPLGSPAGSNSGGSNQFYPSNINPLQDHTSARSEGNSEYGKFVEVNSTPVESKADGKGVQTQNKTSQVTPKKVDVLKNMEAAEEKPSEKKTQDLDSGAEKPKEEASVGTVAKSAEGSDTKLAYDAMVRMAKIASQLKKDDSNQDGNTGSSVPGNDTPATSSHPN